MNAAGNRVPVEGDVSWICLTAEVFGCLQGVTVCMHGIYQSSSCKEEQSSLVVRCVVLWGCSNYSSATTRWAAAAAPAALAGSPTAPALASKRAAASASSRSLKKS